MSLIVSSCWVLMLFHIQSDLLFMLVILLCLCRGFSDRSYKQQMKILKQRIGMSVLFVFYYCYCYYSYSVTETYKALVNFFFLKSILSAFQVSNFQIPQKHFLLVVELSSTYLRFYGCDLYCSLIRIRVSPW